MPTAKGAATRDRILDSVVDALVRGGREAVNLDVVLATTRTSKGQLFHYFPGGKRELIRAATDRQLERLAGAEPTGLDDLAGWERWVDGVIRLHRLQTREDACEVAALAGRVFDPEEERALLAGRFAAWRERLDSGLREMRAAGRMRSDADPAALSALFVAALQGGAVVDKATASLDFLEPALRAALAHLRSFAVAGSDTTTPGGTA